MLSSIFRKNNIRHATHAECPNCEEVGTVESWNKIVVDTYGKKSPDIRLAALNKKNSFPYQCPSCFKGYSAHIIKFSTENKADARINNKTKEPIID